MSLERLARGLAGVVHAAVVLIQLVPSTVLAQTATGLAPGQTVKVEGRAGEDAIRAERLRVRDGDGHVRIESQITSIEDDGRTLRVLGFEAHVPDAARVLDGETPLPGPALLRRGDRVEVRGSIEPSGRIIANRVRRNPRIGDPRDELEGPIEAVIGDSVIRVLGQTVRLGRDTKVTDEREVADVGRLRRDDDEQQVGGLRFGEWGIVGGRFETVYEDVVNPDLDATMNHDALVRPGLRLEAAARLGRSTHMFGKVDVTREFDPRPTGTGITDVQVREAHVTVSLVGPLAVQAGRIRVRDAFEWYADDYVDGARLLLRGARTTVEVGASSGLATAATSRSRSDERQLFASVTHELDRALTIAVHGIARDDRTRGESPSWLFVQAYGQLEGLRYWGNVAARRGRSSSGTLGGWAFDGGTTLRPAVRWPAVTLGFAVGSGDRNRGDSHDTTFRQTGMEDTETRFAGFKRLHTYGQLLQPDLSNLRVLTAAVGWPWRTASFDAVHHVYWQDVPRRSAASSSLDLRPDGAAGVLGHETDLLLTLRVRTGIDFSIIGGVYVPRGAQSAPRGSSWFWRPQLQLFF